MSKDYAKFGPRRSHASQQKKRRIIAVMVLLVVFSVTVTLHNPGMLSKMISFTKAKKMPPDTTTKLATKTTDNGPPPVHFDFYEALPNMQMPVADNLGNKQAVAILKPVASAPKPIAITPPLKTSVFNPAEVSDLLASEKNIVNTPIGQRYSVQLGIFETEAAARRLSSAINSLGFQLRVVKIHGEGHNSYHVQQGPFATLESAKALQLRLQKRGITSTLKKA